MSASPTFAHINPSLPATACSRRLLNIYANPHQPRIRWFARRHLAPFSLSAHINMFTINFLSAVAAATLLSMASAQTRTATGEPSSTVWSIGRPSQTIVGAKKPTNLGCFNSSAPLEDHGAFKDFQARGNCQLVCVWLNKPVMALSEGDHCWCGDMIPANNTLIDDSHCDIPCPGYPDETCMLF